MSPLGLGKDKVPHCGQNIARGHAKGYLGLSEQQSPLLSVFKPYSDAEFTQISSGKGE